MNTDNEMKAPRVGDRYEAAGRVATVTRVDKNQVRYEVNGREITLSRDQFIITAYNTMCRGAKFTQSKKISQTHCEPGLTKKEKTK